MSSRTRPPQSIQNKGKAAGHNRRLFSVATEVLLRARTAFRFARTAMPPAVMTAQAAFTTEMASTEPREHDEAVLLPLV